MKNNLSVTKQVKGSSVILAIGGNRASKLGFVDLLHNWGITDQKMSQLESDGTRVYVNVNKAKLESGLTNKTICNLPDATLAQFKGKRYGAWALAKSMAAAQIASWQDERLAIAGPVFFAHHNIGTI